MSAERVVVQAEPVPEQAVTVAERTVCLILRAGKLGDRRKVESSDVAPEDVDPDTIHVAKTILESAELDKIRKLDSEIRAYVITQSVPSSYLAPGVHRIPLASVAEIDARLDAFLVKRQELIEAFLAAYPTLIQEARTRLGTKLFKEADYPTVEKARASFTLSREWGVFETPDTLRSVSEFIYRRECTRVEEQLAVEAEDIKAALRLEMKGLVDHMLDRLTPDPETGKPKVFRASMVDNMAEFLYTIKARNVVGDQDLAALADQARKLLRGVDAPALRKGETKAVVASQLTRIKAQLDELVTEAPARRIRFGGDR